MLRTQEISLVVFPVCRALVEHILSHIEASNPTAQIEHEATTSKIGEDRSSTANNELLKKKKL